MGEGRSTEGGHPPSRVSTQFGKHALGLGLLLGIAFLDDLGKQFAGAFLVAHLLVGLGQFELGRHVVALGRRRGGRCAQIKADGAKIELRLDRGGGLVRRRADIEVEIDNLVLPGPGQLQAGDVIEFRLWAIDNCGTVLEQFHRYVLE